VGGNQRWRVEPGAHGGPWNWKARERALPFEAVQSISEAPDGTPLGNDAKTGCWRVGRMADGTRFPPRMKA